MHTDLRAWTVRDAIDLYNVHGWGRDFFSVNEAGHVEVTPAGPGSPKIDLKELVDDLRNRGCNMPLLIRFSDILRTRVQQLCGSFQQAILENDYRGSYRGVYPIKVNQQRHVVEELVEYGKPYNLGLDATSFGECLASGRHDAAIEASRQLGSAAGVNSTPSFFVNGRKLRGVRALEDFETIFREELARAGS